jgi:hypothetical protein
MFQHPLVNSSWRKTNYTAFPPEFYLTTKDDQRWYNNTLEEVRSPSTLIKVGKGSHPLQTSCKICCQNTVPIDRSTRKQDNTSQTINRLDKTHTNIINLCQSNNICQARQSLYPTSLCIRYNNQKYISQQHS